VKAIDAFEQALIDAITLFTGTYDRLRLLEVARATELALGKAAVNDLHKVLRSFIGLVSANRNLEGFDASDYGDSPDVMDDVINDAKSFVQVVEEHKEQIPSADLILQEVGAALAIAETEWSEAMNLRQEYQALIEENRTNAQALHELLIAFRATLRATIGRANPAYQSLRAKTISRTVLEPEDEEILAPVPEAAPDAPVEETLDA
jgi:hypothetical protein